MPQTNTSRRHSQNVNTDRVEYHLIDTPTSTEIAEAYTSYTFIPAPEAITLIAEQPKIIKISGYHYRLLGTVDPGGQIWDSSNTFPALYANNTYITVYTTVSASTSNYLKIGTDAKGYKYYQKVNEESYYELIGKMPNELEYGELGIGRSANNEVMYIKNSDGQMVEFRSYKANVDYVNNEITDETRYFAKSSSGTSVTAMTATLVDSRNFAVKNNKPINGTKVDVYFSTAHTTSTATLNINNTGAFTLVYNDSQFDTSMIDAGTILSLVFDKEYNNNTGCYRVVGGYVHIMSGATALADGKIGLVPKPLTGYQNKYLRGDGTWQDVSAGTTNTFNTIAVSGQTSIVADTSTDTLTLVAGSGVNITTDASTDTVTFSATGGGSVGSQHMAAYSIIKNSIVTYSPMSFVTELFYPIVKESISNDTTIFIDKMRCYEAGILDGHIPVGSIIIIYSCYLYSLGLISGRFIWDTPGFGDYFNYIVCNGDNQLYETENTDISDASVLNSNGIYLYTFNWDGNSLPSGINDWVSTYAARVGDYNAHIGGSASNAISHKYIFHISDIEINENKVDTITGFVDELKKSPQAAYEKIKSGQIFNADRNESLFNKIVVSLEHRSVVSSEGANIFYPS